VVLVGMADEKGVYGKAREVYRLAVGTERKPSIEKNRCLSR
jgi:hypothetical protein